MIQNGFVRKSMMSFLMIVGVSAAPAISMAQLDPKEMTLEQATQLVKKSLENTEILSSKSYCTKGTMTCRTMYRLKDKVTGKASPVLYDSFYSADRQVASTCYFVPSKEDPKKYYVLTDGVFDGKGEGKIQISIIGPQFATVEVSENSDEIIFGNIKSPVLGTTRYTLGAFYQTENDVILEGTTYDSQKPEVKDKVYIEYFRIHP